MAAKTKAKAKTSKAANRPDSILQLKATLLNIDPPVWRRLLVPADFSLGDLHGVLQTAFGWDNAHLHLFDIAGTHYSHPEIGEDGWGPPILDEEGVTLRAVVGKKKKFRYEYDFGDSWEHEIIVEKTLEPEPNARNPRCTAGKRACPPEDCGGPWGYADFLAALADPKHPNHAEMRQWFGEEFDPEAFDRDAVNIRLTTGAGRVTFL